MTFARRTYQTCNYCTESRGNVARTARVVRIILYGTVSRGNRVFGNRSELNSLSLRRPPYRWFKTIQYNHFLLLQRFSIIFRLCFALYVCTFHHFSFQDNFIVHTLDYLSTFIYKLCHVRRPNVQDNSVFKSVSHR